MAEISRATGVDINRVMTGAASAPAATTTAVPPPVIPVQGGQS
jgi:hypothetical protein